MISLSFSRFPIFVAALVFFLAVGGGVFAEQPSSVYRVIPTQLDLFDIETQEPVKSVLRVELEGKTIPIKNVIADGAGYEIDIPGVGEYLIYSEDVETNLDAEFQKKCRTQVTSASAAASGSGRAFGAGCSK
ncbi:hypothetical protein [Nisaea sp.]|uniref:hypothetical protein n=1 Tax=Nisaea sp. TaxID=2024842 RepID=UPI003B523E29